MDDLRGGVAARRDPGLASNEVTFALLAASRSRSDRQDGARFGGKAVLKPIHVERNLAQFSLGMSATSV